MRAALTLAALALTCASARAQTTPALGEVTVVIRPDGTVRIEADVALADLAARVRDLVPTRPGAHVTVRLDGAVGLAQVSAVVSALREFDTNWVKVVQRVPVKVVVEPTLVTVQVDPAGATSIDGMPVKLADLGSRVLSRADGDHGVLVSVGTTSGTPYGRVVEVMQALAAAGLTRVGLFPAAPSRAP